MTTDVNVILLDFKTTKGKEMITANEDGTYTIFINSRLSHDGQLKAYQHAIEHIENGDFEKDDVQKIEMAAHHLSLEKKEKVVSAIEFEKYMQKLRKERKAMQRRLHEHEKKMRFLHEGNPERYFQYIENQYLYGSDL